MEDSNAEKGRRVKRRVKGMGGRSGIAPKGTRCVAVSVVKCCEDRVLHRLDLEPRDVGDGNDQLCGSFARCLALSLLLCFATSAAGARVGAAAVATTPQLNATTWSLSSSAATATTSTSTNQPFSLLRVSFSAVINFAVVVIVFRRALLPTHRCAHIARRGRCAAVALHGHGRQGSVGLA